MDENRSSGFAVTVLHAVTWRAMFFAQLLGVLFALTFWLERMGRPEQPVLLFRLTEQALTANCMVLAALAGDEAVRRGWTVLRSFIVVLLCAGVATAIAQWFANQLLGFPDPRSGWARTLTTFFNVGALWGTALMAYLNRQSAARLLSNLRAGELGRVQAERNLIASHLAAADAQVDPATVIRKLTHVRELYAAGEPEADRKFEDLIEHLRETVARGH